MGVVSAVRTAFPGSDGVRLSALRRVGDPSLPTVLLVHGLASNARLWDGVSERLGGLGFPTVAVDLRGHGESDRVEDGFDMATVADDLAAVLTEVTFAPALVAGQSWGGNVVVELAARHPELVRGVLLVDGGFIRLADRFASWEEAEAALAPPRFDGLRRDDLVERAADVFPGFPPSGVHGQLANFEDAGDGTIRPRLSRANHMRILRHLYEHDPFRTAPEVEVPVWVLAVSGDMTPRGAVEAFVADLPDGRLIWAEGHHDIHAQQPDVVAGLVADMASVTEPTGP